MSAAPALGATHDVAQAEAAATRDNGLAEFFARERRRAERRTALPLALLSQARLRYLFSRGAAAFARVPVRTALHAAEIVVFADFLELGWFGAFLAIRSVLVAFGAFQWGALEPLRRGVRALVARGEVPAAERLITRHLRLAVDLCIFELAVLIAWLELVPRPHAAFNLLDAYAIACCVRAIAETVTRSYHAGAFALRRVPRPFATLFAVDLADAAVPLLLWPWLGPWGFALGQLAGTGVEVVLALRYTRRAYRDLPVGAPTFRRVLFERRARGEPGLLRDMLAPGLGNLVSQVDALLIAALAFGTSPEGIALAAGLHVLRPVLGLCGGWARVFYFDLARLEGPVRRLFRARFERSLLHAVPWFALAAAALAALLSLLLAWSSRVPALGLVPILAFLPFLVARSFFAAAQVRAFVNGAYRALALGAAVVGALVVLLVAVELQGWLALALAPAALAVAGGLFQSGLGARVDTEDPAEKLVAPFVFLRRLRASEGPLRVLVLTLNSRAGARAVAVANALAELSCSAFATRWSRRRILLACNGAAAPVSRVVAASAGTLSGIEALPASESGSDAADALLVAGLLGVDLAHPAPDRASLVRDFSELFPSGTVLGPHGGGVARSLATPIELSRTLAEVSALSLGLRPARRRGLRAAVYAPAGQAELVFLAARETDAATFADFEQRTFRASVVGTHPQPDAGRPRTGRRAQ